MSRDPGYGAILGSREYLLDEIVAFRALMGLRDAWCPPERMAAHLRGLLFAWLRTEGATEADNAHMEAVCTEYDRRLAHVLCGGENAVHSM